MTSPSTSSIHAGRDLGIVRVRVAYVEEPPFYATGSDGSATGADVELAQVVLDAIGVRAVEFVPTTFGELLPGVRSGRWEMNVPIFITDERAKDVAFSRPVWTLLDAFVVQKGNPKALTGYRAVAESADARLGVIPGQVQLEAAHAAGVPQSRVMSFADQPAAVRAVVSGRIDAFAATAVGNRSITDAHPELESVTLEPGPGGAPFGAFSFGLDNQQLRAAVNAELDTYLGSDDHRSRMAKYGIGASEIDGVLRVG